MALQKTISLPNGASGNYVRVGTYAIDRLTREASIQFMLHGSAALAASAPDAPLCMIAKLRLNGAKFDEYLSSEALAAVGQNIVEQLYVAAKAEPLLAGGGLTQAQLDLSDATDV